MIGYVTRRSLGNGKKQTKEAKKKSTVSVGQQ